MAKNDPKKDLLLTGMDREWIGIDSRMSEPKNTTPPRGGRVVVSSYARYIVRTCVRVLVDDVTAFRRVYRRRSVGICSRARRYRYAYHQTCRLEVHNLCHWFLIHFHNFPILAAKVRQIFDICKFLPYFLPNLHYFTKRPVASYSFSPRRMKI